MARFGHVIVSGIAWILLALGLGFFGLWLIARPGLWGVLGWPVAFAGFGFAVMSAVHLWRITRLKVQGMRWERADPEGFEEARREYDEAMRRQDEEPS